jgi:hypothetical protein
MKLGIRAAVTILAVALCASAADEKKAFNATGTWKLNVDKSDFGPMPPSKSQVMTIKESGDKVETDIKAESDMGVMDFHMSVTKGKDSVNDVMGMEFHTMLTDVPEGQQNESWAELPNGGGKFEQKMVSKLSEDGKVLTEEVWMKSPMGEANQKLVFDKQ